jgi:alpha-tubulin suppressor-like RCC1 family protein
VTTRSRAEAVFGRIWQGSGVHTREGKTLRRLTNILTIAGGLFCLLLASRTLAQTGAVLGFGNNAFAQLGDGTTLNRTLPNPTHQISGIKAISCGANHTLALDSTGVVWAWGRNGRGQLGTGDTTDRSKPVAVLGGIKAIATGGEHNLALRADGSVWAWGDNAMGQLGTGDYITRLYPTKMVSPYNTRIKAIATGGWHSLLLDDQNMLYGCGKNAEGQLAQHNFNGSYPSLVFISRWVKAMTGGFGHTLIQTTYNSAMAAGYNAYGQIGDGTIWNRDYLSHCGDNVRAIAAGWMHSLVVRQDGRVLAWGSNFNGELGMGDLNARFTPTLMPGAINVKAVAGGSGHTLVLLANGNVLATGLNVSGQLGDGTTIKRTSLTLVKNASLIGSISAGLYHSFLLRPFTKTLATGDNTYGQLGINSTVYKTTPVPMLSGSNMIAVAAGPRGNHTLLLRADGSVWACGYNDYGQLGNGTINTSTVPLRVKGPGGVGFLANIIAIAAGDKHSMALAADGTVYTWGYNYTGTLGLGNNAHQRTPVQVPGSRNVFAIAAGGFHSLLLADEGWVGATGSNDYGQLGLGDTLPRYRFTRINGSFSQIAIAAGGSHSMSLDYYAGSLYTWGYNGLGQLGLGDTSNRLTPTYKSGTIASTIACGGSVSMHLNGRGETYVSGYNVGGLLGLGDTAQRNSWTFNPHIPEAIGVTGGDLHTLFVNVYGNLYGTGYNGNGQLGDGTTTSRFVPTYIPGAPYTTSVAAGGYHSVILTTPPVMLASLTISPTSLRAGNSATGTVRLNGVAGPGGQRVYLYWDHNAANMPYYVDVAPTSNTATFSITTNRSLANTITVNVHAYLNTWVSSTLTVHPWVLQQ